MVSLSRSLLVVATAGLGACAPHATPAPQTAASSDLVASAQTFMADYARDLRAGDRDAVIGRYDPRGVYLVGAGRKSFVTLDSVRAIYRGGWQPPASFAWRDLSYEVAGPEAVVVTGRFDWGMPGGTTLPMSYTALLVRQGGGWRIRLEDESASPEALKPRLCAPDTARPPARPPAG